MPRKKRKSETAPENAQPRKKRRHEADKPRNLAHPELLGPRPRRARDLSRQRHLCGLERRLRRQGDRRRARRADRRRLVGRPGRVRRGRRLMVDAERARRRSPVPCRARRHDLRLDGHARQATRADISASCSAARSASRSARPARPSSACCCSSSEVSCSRARHWGRSSADRTTRFADGHERRRPRRAASETWESRRHRPCSSRSRSSMRRPRIPTSSSRCRLRRRRSSLWITTARGPAGAALRRHHDGAPGIHASGSQRAAGLAGEGGHVGRDGSARRGAARTDALTLRHRRDGDRPDLRSARHALRAAARAGDEGRRRSRP